jgi:hypothetical protein
VTTVQDDDDDEGTSDLAWSLHVQARDEGC